LMDTCAFCGWEGEDFAPEHWIPQWLSRKLVPEYATGVRHNLPEGSWDADVFELTVKHVCNECNNTWLSEIETKASKFVFPLVIGAPNRETISEVGLRHVARWGYLKTILLELGRPDDHEPTHDTSVYAQFKESRWPPIPNCSLALGVREVGPDEPNPVFVWFSSQGGFSYSTRPPAPWRETKGYRTTLLIGHVIFDVIGVKDAGSINVPHGKGYVPLWPTPAFHGGKFTWPPTRRFRWRGEGLELD
jgi:hypothetical protein